ncbi:MAG: hypothetical protein KF824_00310 [Fimbriimonadaceae bacterium]|nr:MAG: hypothetical protein KF824_00310 [Fimbriimonadaceae bacterium]
MTHNKSMLAGILVILATMLEELPTPIVNGHSHNDYLQARPLLEALAAGMCSIEADIFLIDGVLRVGHDRASAEKGGSLQAMYLDPLVRLPKVANRLGKGWPEIQLLVDIKADGEKVFPILQSLIAARASTFSTDKEIRAVRVVVSGDRPIDLILASKTGWLALDGRPGDVGKAIPVRRMPLISESWTAVGWNKNVELSAENQKLLNDFVGAAHREGRKFRFWGVPDRVDFWRLMVDTQVDWVNTDQPSRLREWMENN